MKKIYNFRHVIFFVFMLLVSIFEGASSQELVASKTFKKTEDKVVLQLYQLMKDVHELLTYYNIDYFAIAGTCLGAIRHNGIIPWDNDLDICIDEKQYDKIVALAPLFNHMGYHVFNFPDRKVVKIYVQKKFKGAHIDILSFKIENDECFYFWKNKNKFNKETIKIHDLFPLKLYKFGNLFIKGPNNPIQYLKSCYGEDCLSSAYMKNSQNIKVVLQENDKMPAMPLGPLLDKVDDNGQVNDLKYDIQSLFDMNEGELSSILKPLKKIYIESFKEYFSITGSSKNKKKIVTILSSRFDKIFEVIVLQRQFISGLYVAMLYAKNNIIGYNLFIEAPISEILNDMIKRAYIKNSSCLPDGFLKTYNTSINDFYIISIALHPAYQKKGLSRYLIFSPFWVKNVIKNIYCLTSLSFENQNTRAIYEHYGFVKKEVFLTNDNQYKALYVHNNIMDKFMNF